MIGRRGERERAIGRRNGQRRRPTGRRFFSAFRVSGIPTGFPRPRNVGGIPSKPSPALAAEAGAPSRARKREPTSPLRVLPLTRSPCHLVAQLPNHPIPCALCVQALLLRDDAAGRTIISPKTTSSDRGPPPSGGIVFWGPWPVRTERDTSARVFPVSRAGSTIFRSEICHQPCTRQGKAPGHVLSCIRLACPIRFPRSGPRLS